MCLKFVSDYNDDQFIGLSPLLLNGGVVLNVWQPQSTYWKEITQVKFLLAKKTQIQKNDQYLLNFI